MDWDLLRYFLAVADAGTLHGAARKLGVNHSTVFRRVDRFEAEVETRLFERLRDGYQLTTAGEELLEHARRAGEEIDLLQLKVLGKDFRPSGKIRLTAPENLAYEYLPRYLTDFSKRYPEISLEIIVGDAHLNLTQREADIAVRATQRPPPHLVGRKILSVRWGYFASKGYLKQKGRPKNSAALAGHRVIGADGALQQIQPFQSLATDLGINGISITCSTLNAMSAMAVAGFGIALLPDDQVKPSLIRLFDVKPQFLSEIWLLTHPELRRTERIRLLMNHLYQAFRSDVRLQGLSGMADLAESLSE